MARHTDEDVTLLGILGPAALERQPKLGPGDVASLADKAAERGHGDRARDLHAIAAHLAAKEAARRSRGVTPPTLVTRSHRRTRLLLACSVVALLVFSVGLVAFGWR